jgi:signal transduction histidine kinase
MLQAQREHIQDEVNSISSNNLINEVVILSRAQKVYASGEASQVGQIVRNDEDIAQALATGETVTRVERKYGRTEFCVIQPLVNKPECRSCHGSEAKILGVIEIGVDRSSLDAQTGEQTRLLGLIGGITVVAVGGMLTIVLRSAVVNPLSKLAASARRISAGNLSARAEVAGKDEVSMVARTFNEMVERVEQHAHALENSNAELERRVRERTNDLRELYEQLRQQNEERSDLLEKIITAQEEERRRLARGLHDGISQTLTGLVMSLGSAEAVSVRDPAVRQRLEFLRGLTSEAVDEVRRIIHDLRPSLLDDLGLVAAIGWYIENYLAPAGVKAELKTQGLDRRLPPNVEIALFRVVQEAITNIVKHAQARTTSIRLQLTDSTIVGSVEDDGVGFNADALHHERRQGMAVGLLGMEERISLLEGKLDIESHPGEGTQVHFKIPWQERSDEEDSHSSS